jgi:hypothetical protein
MKPCTECGGAGDDQHQPSCSQFVPAAPPAPPAPAKPKRGRPPGSKTRKHRRRAAPPLALGDGIPHAGLVQAAAAATDGDPAAPPVPGAKPTPAAPAPRTAKHITKDQLLADNARLARENAQYKTKQDAAGTMDEGQVAAMLTGTLQTLLGKVLPRVLGVPDAALTDDECKTLGDVWAPVATPFLATHGESAPLALAVITTLGIGYRPVMAYVEARQATALPPVPIASS